MTKGFIYVVRTVGGDYQQPNRACVPTLHENRLYFGPCKVNMRRRMHNIGEDGDYVFGISPAGTNPRRIVFIAIREKMITYKDAYEQHPYLRGGKESLNGMDGPIHVKPIDRRNHRFPKSHYQHIPGATHKDDWIDDIADKDLDSFFVFKPAEDCVGRWLGPHGPAVEGSILDFLKNCVVYGQGQRYLRSRNDEATPTNPIRHGGLNTGLHLETHDPETLARLCCKNILPPEDTPIDEPPDQYPRNNHEGCDGHQTPRVSTRWKGCVR